MPSLPHRLALPLLPLTFLLGACGSAGTAGTRAEGEGEAADGGARLEIVTSVYPVQWLTERVAGDRARVTVLTGAGADPHDVELTPRVVGSLGSADLVIYSSGLQPAVDEAVASQAAEHALDVAGSADLVALGETAQEHADHAEDGTESEDDHVDHSAGSEEDHADHSAGSEDDHADDSTDADHSEDVEAGEDHDGHDHGAEDPHFWLDPERYGHVAEAIAGELATLDPEHAQTYEANAEALVAELDALDEEFAAGLARCEHRDLVTTHEAFGYLADRYDLHQIGVTGISPESEPSPARLAEVSATVTDLGVETVYAEPILSDAIARTVAQETDARVLTLDPLEGITDASAGEDYLEVMRANLTSLRDGLGCS